MRILVAGATGFIGRHLVQALASEGHELVLASRSVRRQTKIAGQDWRVIDYATAHCPDDWREIVQDIDIAINAVGIFTQSRVQSFEALHDKAPRAMFEACEQAGVKRIVQISALGAEEGATSAYHLSKKRADDALMQGAVDWVILRPSLIIGDDGQSWRFFKALADLPLVPVIGNGRQPLQPVTIGDVTKAVMAAIKREEASRCSIDLVGKQCMSLRDYLQALSRWMGNSRFRPLLIPYGPAGMMAGMLASAGPVFDNMPLNRSAISMLKDARAYEGGECESRLGFVPTGVSQFLAQYPPTHEERIATRQYFLRPLLRLGLAFMWIVAGIVSLFFYPHEQSLALLARLGLHGYIGELSLYGAALLDVFLGLALLVKYRINMLLLFQIGLIGLYTLALSWAAPELWSDPFGALAKNIPIMIATLFVLSWSKE